MYGSARPEPFALPGYALETFPMGSDGELEMYRGVRVDDGARVVVSTLLAPEPRLACVGRLASALRVRPLLSEEWALVPSELTWVEGRPALVSSDPGGQLLTELMARELAPDHLLRLAVSVVTAVRRMHDTSLIHRNLQPGFIMIAAGGEHAWLHGFGCAFLRSSSHEPPEGFAGCPAYVAPEQTGRMHRGMDQRSDLYSLGVILFELLTGRHPFRHAASTALMLQHTARRPPPARSVAEWIPASLEALVDKLLEKEPANRHGSAAEVETELRRCVEELRAQETATSARVIARGPATPARPAPPKLTPAVDPQDIAAFLEVSDALSGEVELEVLMGRVLRIVLEQSGGERALLVSRDLMTVRAEAVVTEDVVKLDTSRRPLRAADAALSVLLRSQEAREIIRIDDAAVPDPRWPDAYLQLTGQRSVLAVPLLHRGRFDGVIYLEDRLVSHAFGDRRTAFLRLLAAHAASALATATLFADLEGSDARYRFLFDNVPIAVLQVDTRGYKVVFDQLRARGEDVETYFRESPNFLEHLGPLVIGRVANLASARLFGVDTVEEVLRPLGDVWNGSQETLRRSLLARLAGKKGYSERTKVRAYDGRVVDVFFAIVFGAEDADSGPFDIVNFVDLSDLVDAEQRVERLQAEFAHAARVSMLGEIGATLAHELNQPLAAIMATAGAARRWLTRDTPSLAHALAAIDRLEADAARAADVVERIRSMAVNRAPERTASSINHIIEGATQFLQYELSSRGVALTLDLAHALEPVEVDRIQVQQVIVNLTVNAIQAVDRGPEGGRERMVTIRSRREGSFVRVLVEDTGPGLPPVDPARLFESFFSTRADGMGMGLTICRSLVEAHSGVIEASNRPEGGAVFSFTLPTLDEEAR